MQTLCNAYCGEAFGSTDISMLEKVKDAILRMTYYWYTIQATVNDCTPAVAFASIRHLISF